MRPRPTPRRFRNRSHLKSTQVHHYRHRLRSRAPKTTLFFEHFVRRICIQDRSHSALIYEYLILIYALLAAFLIFIAGSPDRTDRCGVRYPPSTRQHDTMTLPRPSITNSVLSSFGTNRFSVRVILEYAPLCFTSLSTAAPQLNCISLKLYA